jgi:hypothetical protein
VRFGEGRVLQRGHVPAKGSAFERSASEKIVSRETLKDSPLEGIFLQVGVRTRVGLGVRV